MRTGYATIFALGWLFSAGAVHAATRAVVVPVLVGGGPEPDARLLTALAAGLKDNRQWGVETGDALKALAMPAKPALKDEDLARIESKIGEASAQIAQDAGAAAAALEGLRVELDTAAKVAPLGDRGDALAFRAGALLAAAHAAGNDTEKAKAAARELALRFPGRKPADTDQLPPSATELLAAPMDGQGAKLTLKSRPEGCEIVVNGTAAGRTSIDLAVLPGATYWAEARCAGQGGAADYKSYLKKIVVAPDDTARQEVLDAEFERAFAAEGSLRLRFTSSNERRQIEDSYARRVAEKLGVDLVVFVSVGELSGSDWLNGRLYLKSGYLNRQGWVRLEADRAGSLGRYLSTGKEVPGVLKPEEAGALVAASKGPAATPQEAPAWYTDVPGWCLVGTGLVAVGVGTLLNSKADRKKVQGDGLKGMGEFDRQQSLYREASNLEFWGGIGTIGGGIMAAVGVVLLAVPEQSTTQGELFVLRPTLGIGSVGVSGSF